jgi:hypothetical protein
LVTSAPGLPTREVHDHQEGVEPIAVTLPAFTALEESLFLTLYARALDNRAPHPILAAMADELVHKLDYDFGQLHIDTNLILNVALGPRSWTRWRRSSWPATRTRSGLTWAPGWTSGWSAWPPVHRRLV